MTNVLVPLADGVEEMEAVIIIDVLRRAECRVVAAGLKSLTVTASRKVVLVADALLGDVSIASFDAIVLPGGGPGTAALRADRRVIDAVRVLHSGGKLVGAICAAALVLHDAGLLDGRRFTSHPSVSQMLTQGTRVDERLVEDGNILTSQGPGTAFDFALAVAARLKGQRVADAVASAMIL